jgi:predicted O-methyltransferase YrrM
MKNIKRLRDSSKYRSAKLISISGLFSKRESKVRSLQDSQFEKMSLDRIKGLQRLGKILRSEFDREYSEDRGMWSEHLVLFASISVSKNQIRNILEIGTHKGETTRILHQLFPDANITTIDLPDRIAKESQIYTYSDSDQIIVQRKANIGSIDRINQLQMNSCGLVFHEQKYDLIWLDGAHGYPICAIDVTNAVRMVSVEGFIICDDVYTRLKHSDEMYDSTATHEVLEAFRKSEILHYELLYKRLSIQFNFWKSQTKYLAVAKLT